MECDIKLRNVNNKIKYISIKYYLYIQYTYKNDIFFRYLK